ncbi:hypothetical protein [Phreatobacter sp.]|uniref:hypothetical protein n=1 Tax=Phreatobacter sp. TaxID=1966341 RepID=UPI0022C5506F|nr:hypothetical protein [Phreatobacter sp.]MCZ8314247.1 hypothetical protein [Phreatobacter sp.]
MVSAVSAIVVATAAGLVVAGIVDVGPVAIDAGLLVAAFAGAGLVPRFAEAGH